MASPTVLFALAAERQAQLEKMLPAAKVSWAVRTESTSDDAKAAAAGAGGRVHVFVADSQTKGRGRNGNAWSTDPGAGLLLSVLLFPDLQPLDAPRITLAIGAAIAERLDATLAALGARGATAPSRSTKVKWPNDIEVDGKKLAGILVEAQTRGDKLASVVVGVGINVVPSYLDAEVAKRAAALTTPDHVAGLDRAALAFEVVDAILSATRAFESSGLAAFLEPLAARDALAGARVRVGDVEGTAEGITAAGELRVRTSSGETLISAGTIERLDG